MANVELLDKTLAYIEANQNEWNQRYYASCFCGLGLKLEGWEVQRPADPSCATFLSPENQISNTWGRHTGFAPEVGAVVFDLTLDQRRKLFDWENTLEDLRRIVADIKASA